MRLFYIPRYSVSLFLTAGPAPTFDGVRQIFQVLEFKMQELSELIESAQREFAEANAAAALEDAKARYLGKTGSLTMLMKELGRLAPEERRARGQEINRAKQQVEAALNARREALAAKLAQESIDVTLPGRMDTKGGIHPVMRTWMRIEEIFRSIGFDVADGPEIESDWFSFTALNNPPNHPARSMQDTFYVDRNDDEGRPLPLRPHTSPMQVRYARTHQPPIKVISPGRTYRVDSDATHSPMFHQVEGLWLDTDISFTDLKGVYSDFLRCFFETNDLVVRFRPSYFPFTEPSVEVDVSCFQCGGCGCKLCKGTGWIEVLGAGVVNNKVLEGCGIDTNEYSGFAFGIGIERIAMLKYGINNIKLLFESDLRVLKQIDD